MDDDFLLMNPGPVPLHPRVENAFEAPIYSHRSEEFEEVYAECNRLMRDVFQTDDDVLLVNGSGSASMEAAVANAVDEDDTVVSLVNGKFGRRFRRISDRHAGRVHEVSVDWGESFDLAEVEREIESVDPDLVTLVHNATSTGIRNPAKEVGEIADDVGALFVMDGVTSIGGDDVRVDDWGVDAAVVGSQKCLGAPPGLSALSLSPAMKDAVDGDSAPFYLDLDKHLGKLDDSQTPYTSSVTLFVELREALRVIDDEGLDSRVKRHRRLSKAVREAAEAMGMEMFPELRGGSEYSNTVTAIEIPDETTDEEIRGGLMERNISISGGQAHLGGDIIRIATMANCGDDDVLRTIEALEEVLETSAFEVEDSGVNAAHDVL